MFSSALIVFRETLEAALFVGIVAAATRGLPARARWLGAGVLVGLTGAVVLAAGAERIGAWAGGIGQDLVNVGILGAALAMLAWHCIWVSTHAQEMVHDARHLGSSVRAGVRAPWALAIAVALAVLREGAETVLFIAGLAAGSTDSATSMATGVALGLAGGIGIGALIYVGLAWVQPRHLFGVTNALILLVAAAIGSQLARALAQAGLVERWSTPVWDSSAWLANDSALGGLLHALVGYDAQPSALQLVAYLGVLTAIGAATRVVRRRSAAARTATRSVSLVAAPHAGPLGPAGGT